ncbi:DUF2975 domain-containing protein [Macrococcus lamae]|nr:DUF2975 domain-containing protein [Macrococcus lamae]
MRTKNIKFLKFVIIMLGIIFTFLALYVLPLYANSMAAHYPEYAYLKNPLLFGIILTLLPLLISFFQAYRLLNLIEQNNVFSARSTNALKQIKRCALAIIILYMIGMIFLLIEDTLHPSLLLAGLSICLMTTVISMFASILKELLTYAISYKNENDLTI